VAYGQLGATHHSLHDIAVLRTFPGMEIYLPCDVRETRKLCQALVNHPKPAYIRVGRNAVPDVYENDEFKLVLGKDNTIMEGNDLSIIGTGENCRSLSGSCQNVEEKRYLCSGNRCFFLKTF
jgi:transketolase